MITHSNTENVELSLEKLGFKGRLLWCYLATLRLLNIPLTVRADDLDLVNTCLDAQACIEDYISGSRLHNDQHLKALYDAIVGQIPSDKDVDYTLLITIESNALASLAYILEHIRTRDGQFLVHAMNVVLDSVDVYHESEPSDEIVLVDSSSDPLEKEQLVRQEQLRYTLDDTQVNLDLLTDLRNSQGYIFRPVLARM